MMNTITINFDMDGTIANLYGVENWLDYLIAKSTFPYENARPLLRFSALARRLNTLQKKGYQIAIISWLSKDTDANYDNAVTQAKIKWLEKHLPSVHWDKLIIVPYGTPKENYCNNPLDILFDDEQKNRDNWKGIAYNVTNILEILKEI